MKTLLLQVEDDPQQHAAVGQAAQILRRGGLVAFPTETVYGLGADATSVPAVEAVYAVKQRPLDNPLIVHIAAVEELEEVAIPPDSRAGLLARSFWPGPLTVVLAARQPIRKAVCRGRETAAIRMPSHPVALALIRRTGRPLAAPSANLSGRLSPTTAAHVLEDLDGRIPLILDGGPCRVGIESTVLDLAHGPPKVLRPGGVTRKMLAEVLGEPVAVSDSEEDALISPGMRHRHYQPRAPVYLIEASVSEGALSDFLDELSQSGRSGKLGYLGNRPSIRCRPDVIATAQRRGEAEMARHLYADLRELDRLSARVILADMPSSSGLGRSLRDRLSRASSGILEEREGKIRSAGGSSEKNERIPEFRAKPQSRKERKERERSFSQDL